MGPVGGERHAEEALLALGQHPARQVEDGSGDDDAVANRDDATGLLRHVERRVARACRERGGLVRGRHACQADSGCRSGLRATRLRAAFATGVRD